MELILSATGESVPLGRHVQAVVGPYTGTWWRIDDVVKAENGHRVLASRSHQLGRHRVCVPPHVFGLVIEEAVRLLRHLLNICHVVWSKVDEGLVMGVLALPALSLVDPEVARHLWQLLQL